MAKQAEKIQVDQDWIRNTEAGEMPDTSNFNRLRRRLTGDATVLSAEFRAGKSAWIAVAVTIAVVGLGGYLLWDRFANVEEDQPGST